MATWQKVAEGTSLKGLKLTAPNLQLTSGQRVKVVLSVPSAAAKAFDTAGAEVPFRAAMPNGMRLVDVYEENGQGIVEMEATSPFLLAVIGFIAANWLAITIAGFTLAVLAVGVKVLVKVGGEVEQAANWLAPLLLVGGAVVLLGSIKERTRRIRR